MTKKSKLFNNERLEITIDRLCHQLLENHKNFHDTVLIGLQPRGIFFLDRIKNKIIKILNKEIKTGILDTTFYRDDFRSRDIPPAKETSIPFIVDEKDVIIIDDVLLTRELNLVYPVFLKVEHTFCLFYFLMIFQFHYR